MPQIRRNLIYVSKFVEHSYSFLFGKNKVTIKLNNEFVACGLKENVLYLLIFTPNVLTCENSSTSCIMNTSKRKKI